MGQQEGKREASGAGDSASARQDHSLTECLDALHLALDVHRLVFLCVGCAVGLPPEFPRKPPRILGSGGPPLPKEVTKEQLAGAGRDFILKLRPTLERYAQRALYELGAGKGQYWHIDPEGAYYLQGTSDRILAACTGLSTEDAPGAFTDVVEAAIRVMHDNDQPTWTAGKKVRWEYLEEVDTVIKAVNVATVKVRRTEATPETEEVYVEIDLAKRVITIGTEKHRSRGRKVWEFLATLQYDHKTRVTPRWEEGRDWKNQVDTLSRTVGGTTNLHRIVQTVAGGYRLADNVRIVTKVPRRK